MIRFDDVTKCFEGQDGSVTVAVDRVSFEVADGETVCLIGTSGCGKTTTLKMVNRLVEPSSGRVLVDGVDVRTRDLIELRRSIGYVIQDGGLFPHLSVARNVGIGCELEGWSADRTSARVRELLAQVNLPPDEFLERFPGELSGGQRQRVGVARALALDPPHLLMDEPFGALDPITRRQVRDEFVQIENEVGKTIMIVTHDLREAFQLGDRVALMDAGRVVQLGTEREFMASAANDFVRAFLADHADGSGEGAPR